MFYSKNDFFHLSLSITVCIVTHWEQKKQMKFSPPTKGIGMRKVIRKRGYDVYLVYLVNEYKTSKINFFTKTENEKFRRRQNERPWMKDVRKCQGLIRTKCVLDSITICKKMLPRQ